MKAFIRDLILKRRTALNITQRELADKSGVSQAQISKVEGARQDVKVIVFVKILRALGLKMKTEESRQ